ncbi:MAG: glucose-6-phosphate dehydrogenase, partial [Deltaproteobacteria bacterium]|nr:glucose-6-phosphate dehydrogenase [Deltaproteobacteria bacterium]
MDNPALATTMAQDMGLSLDACAAEDRPGPCMIVIVGASGDLTARKIVPALFSLYVNGGLPDPFLVVGCARTEMDDHGFREKMKKALRKSGPLDEGKWAGFSRLLHYRPVGYEDLPSFAAMADSLKELNKEHGTGWNRVFYLAIPPSLYKSTAQMFGTAGLSTGGA